MGKKLRLYYLWQTDNTGYDTYDCCVVCAENKDDAKSITPTEEEFVEDTIHLCWAKKKEAIGCVEIGIASKSQERGVIIASFNAG